MNNWVVVLHKQHPSYFQEELLHGLCNTVIKSKKHLNVKQKVARKLLELDKENKAVSKKYLLINIFK
jgi:hypothetical protein